MNSSIEPMAKILDTGYCKSVERIVLKKGRLKIINCHALFTLIKHPTHGIILVDTGYAEHVKDEISSFPYSIYGWLTPMYFKREDNAVNQLRAENIEPEDVNLIIISHFHADHIGGLKDFPNAQFIYTETAYNAVKNLVGIKAVKHGFLPGLLPDNFEERSLPINGNKSNTINLPYSCFPEGYDLLGDQSLIGIPLPGHAYGQMGVLLPRTTKTPIFLIADACWHSRAYREMEAPHSIASLILDNYTDYLLTLIKLHHFHKEHKEVLLLPTHCPEVLDRHLSNNCL